MMKKNNLIINKGNRLRFISNAKVSCNVHKETVILEQERVFGAF